MKKFIFSAVLALSICAPSFAEAECAGETINAVVVHKNGNIYFTSSKSCQTNWCQIGSDYSADAKKFMLTMLMAAKENKTSTTITWAIPTTAAAACLNQSPNNTYPQPVYIKAE